MKQRVLFVCLGNICRSPSAEAVFNALITKEGLTEEFEVDSAGISDWHQGEPADRRMQQHARKRNYNLTSLSRPVIPKDFENFDYIVAMDRSNLRDLKARAPKPEYLKKIFLMTDFLSDNSFDEVPDPYYGGDAGFELVLDLLEDSSQNFLKFTRQKQNR
ncbi:MAG: low molecular weight phosphotyrosine protein phosphatase [Bacteroidales bacterium]|nr:low molecular weight phosphotyrosine protein phosphatase [Bacteroidales bacterium]